MTTKRKKFLKLMPGTGTAKRDAWLRGRPVADATTPFMLWPNEKDCKGATPGDPRHCPLSRCVQRTFKEAIKDVFFWRSVAYIGFITKSGYEYVCKYILSEEAKRFIIRFDSHKPMLPNEAIVLLVPKGSHTIEGGRTQKKQHQARKVKLGIPHNCRSTDGKPFKKAKPISPVLAKKATVLETTAARVVVGGMHSGKRRLISSQTDLVRTGRGWSIGRYDDDLGSIAKS